MEIAKVAEISAKVVSEVERAVVGKRNALEMMMAAFLTSGGHVLLEDFPGLAKTLIANSFATALGMKFRRIQFTPDLLPADITGGYVFDRAEQTFEFRPGPIFTNILLADEINRASPRTQSALLEAMGEGQVSVEGDRRNLEALFFVMATQNPIEFRGTYPLPEAQIDRFMLHVKVGHPTREEEKRIMERMAKAALTTGTSKGQSGRKSEALAVGVVASPEQVLKAKETIGHIIVDDKIHDYIVDVVVATRDPKKAGMKDLAGMVAHGASPRASIALNLAARAHAFLRHRGYVTPEDVKAVGPDVLRHRIILTYEAEAEEITSEQVVRRIFETVEVP